MDKIETPEEFAQSIEKAIVHQYQQSPNGRGGLMIISKDYIPAGKLIAARDAAIRADERQKAAERFREAYCQKCEQYGLHDRVNDPCPELARLRAAIMSEPKEATK